MERPRHRGWVRCPRPYGGALIRLCAVLTASAATRPVSAADEWFSRDKGRHFAASAAIAGVAYAGTAAFTPSETGRLSVGGGVAFGAGIAKELIDMRTSGTASFRDLAWDAFGTATGLAVAWLVDRFVF